VSGHRLKSGNTVDAALRDGEVTLRLDGETVLQGRLTMLGPGDGWLEVGGRIHRFYALSRRGGHAEVWLDGKVYQIEREVRAGGGGAAGGPVGDLLAPMPGTVLKILVAAGAEVTAGQPLVVLESMKMEMTLSAAGDARVEKISCKAGDLVEMGAVLVRMTPSKA
jgi:3-methylcrotonyl-CoA carboxylase alpha subunit